MYKEAFRVIQEANYIAVLSHIDPDADAIGSSLAIYLLLKNLNKNISIINYTKEIDIKLDFLPSFSKIKSEFPKKVDLIITCDCGSIDRLGFGFESDIKIINIDHHLSNTNYGYINLIESDFASTSAVVFKFMQENNLKLTPDIATCIYTALVSDTGFFKFEATDESVFELAKILCQNGANPSHIAKMLTQRESLAKFRITTLILSTLELSLDGKVAMVYVDNEMFQKSGANINDLEDISNMVRALVSVEVSIFLKERENQSIRVSLRSKSYVDVSKIALSFGGGGHKRAAGFTLNYLDFKKAHLEILNRLKEVI